MDKMYYFWDKEESLMFFVYDEIKNNFKFVDLAKPETYVKDIEKVPVKDVVVSNFNGKIERLVSEEMPVGFGMLTKTKSSENLESLFTKSFIAYDRENNEYKVEVVTSNRLQDYFNAQSPTNETPGIIDLKDADIPKYNKKYNIFEQNDSRIWYDQITNFMFCNGLIVSSPG